VLALATCAFLWEPLANLRTSTFLTVDVLQNNTLTQLARNYQPRNQLLGDPFTEFVPWMLYAKAELLNGRIPLWNPLNGAGAPLIGNYQSAVFSPFTLPFYVFSLKLALLATSLARVFVTGWFTYLFLRRLALGELAALGGALAFAFCGYNALLLSYPHSAVAAFLPAVLWCAEVILQRCELAWSAGARPRIATWLVLLCLLLVGQALAGHPETLFFCHLISATWMTSRLLALAWCARGQTPGVGARIGLGVRLLLVGLIAAAISAPQLLPFFEYLTHSARLALPAEAIFKLLPREHWARYVFPNLFGLPIDGLAFGPKLPWPNYEISNLAYVGGTVTLLALVSMLRARRDVRTVVSSALLIGWALWAHGAPFVGELVALLPGASLAPCWVSQIVGTFSAAVLAAFELESLLRGEKRRGLAAGTLLVASAALLVVVAPAAGEQMRAVAENLATPAHKLERAQAHVRESSLWIGAASLALTLGYLIGNARLRGALVIAGLVAVFAQTALLFAPYQTACADRYVYPRTRAMITLRRLLGDGAYVSLTREGLPANANMLYGRHQAANYDALLVKEFSEWYVEACAPADMWASAMTADEATLTSLGVEYCTLRPPGVSAPDQQDGKPAPHWNGDPTRLQLLGRIGGQLVHRFDRPARRARLVPFAARCKDDQQWWKRSSAPRPGLEHTVLLGPKTPASFALRTRDESPPPGESNKQRGARRGDPDRFGSVEVLDELPTALRLRVEQAAPNYLVLTQAHYPGWKAYVDGVPAELVRANYAFSALDVPAGEHVIDVRYEPESWRWGLMLLGVGVVALSALWFLTRRAELST